VWKSKIVALVLTATALGSANVFVVANESGIVREPIRSKREDDSILLFHEEVACAAPALLGEAPLA
jgi:hypothetical protein